MSKIIDLFRQLNPESKSKVLNLAKKKLDDLKIQRELDAIHLKVGSQEQTQIEEKDMLSNLISEKVSKRELEESKSSLSLEFNQYSKQLVDDFRKSIANTKLELTKEIDQGVSLAEKYRVNLEESLKQESTNREALGTELTELIDTKVGSVKSLLTEELEGSIGRVHEQLLLLSKKLDDQFLRKDEAIEYDIRAKSSQVSITSSVEGNKKTFYIGVKPTMVLSGGGGTINNRLTWGEITGDLADQTDLQAALDAKLSAATAATTYLKLDGSNDPITGDLTINANLIFDGTRKIIGGTGTTSDLTFQTTSGVGATGADMHFLVGNNGATEAMTIRNSGFVGIGRTSPVSPLEVQGTDGQLAINVKNTGGFDVASLFANSSSNGVIRINRGSDQVTLVSLDADTAVDSYFNGGQVAFGATSATSRVGIFPVSATERGLIIKGFASQSANLQEWQNSSGTALALIDPSGYLALGKATIGTGKALDIFKNNTTGITTYQMSKNELRVTPTATMTESNNSFTAYVDLRSAFNYTDTVNGQTGMNTLVDHSGSGTVSQINGNKSRIRNESTGTITDAIGNRIASATNTGGGTITNLYGLYVESQTVGATLNYAIYTNSGLNRFGDKVLATGELELDGDLNHDGTNIGFFGVTPTTRQTELTDELTTITFTSPGTPDYAIQTLVNVGGYGFVTSDEAQTVLSVIANLQTRVNELETKLTAYGLLIDAD